MTDLEELMDDEVARILAIDAGLQIQQLLQRGAAFETLLIHARDEALAAMDELIHSKFDTLEDVAQKQWEVTRYHALVGWIQAILENGAAAMDGASEEEGTWLQSMIRGEPEERDS
jgi:hypothetical protein